MNDPIIYQALLGLFVIFFIVAAILGGKSWKVLHILLLAGVFFSGGTFFILAAITLNTHDVYRSRANTLEDQISAAEHKIELLTQGPLVASEEELVALEEEADGMYFPRQGIRQLQQKLDYEMLERGRVWRGSGEIDGLKATVVVSRPLPTQLKPNAILFVFEAGKDGSYVGEFKVKSVDTDTIELMSTIDFDQTEQDRLDKLEGDWILREIMPIDSHLVFADQTDEELAAILPDDEAIVNEYKMDGKTVDTDGDRVQVRVRITTRVDTLKLKEFDANGDRVEKEHPVDLKKGDVLLVTPQVAAALLANDEAEEIEKVYVRRLRRYESIFHDINRQYTKIADRIVQINLQIGNVVEATEKVNLIVTNRTTENEELIADKARVDFEKTEVTKYRDALDAEKEKLKASIRSTYQENNRLAKELAALQLKMGSDISDRTTGIKPPSGS